MVERVCVWSILGGMGREQGGGAPPTGSESPGRLASDGACRRAQPDSGAELRGPLAVGGAGLVGHVEMDARSVAEDGDEDAEEVDAESVWGLCGYTTYVRRWKYILRHIGSGWLG